MPNKNSKNCIINAELTDWQWDKSLIGQKFSAFVEMIIEKKSNQALAKQPKDNKMSNKTAKQPAWFATFAQDFQQFKQEMQQFKQEINQKVDLLEQNMQEFKQEINQKVNDGFQQINSRIDNLVVKNKLVE